MESPQHIDSSFFTTNRSRLVKAIPSKSLALFHANDRMPKSADGMMPYHSNSDLFYLTGIEQEESILLVCADCPDATWREILFLKEPNEHLKKWEGHKLSKSEATDRSGINTVMWSTEFHRIVHHIMVMGNVASVFLNANEHYRSETTIKTADRRLIEWFQTHYPLHQYDRVAPIMTVLRVVKSPVEVATLQKACAITEKGFRKACSIIRPGIMEYELEAEYIYAFRRNGSRGFAYDPIIASGSNNCVLHYTANDRPCQAGDLVLMDVGAEYGRYNADVTRTVPVSGRFTKRQKEVYNATLRVMRKAMELMSSSIPFFSYQKEVEKMMEGALVDLNLITRQDIQKQNPQQPAFRKYFYHGVSHMLGLDVHDVGDMHANMKIGSVWTVEPGIYIPEEGFGIRLEDNVVLNDSGVFNLTASIPIEAGSIEELMNKNVN